jgi:hypothetical protein
MQRIFGLCFMATVVFLAGADSSIAKGEVDQAQTAQVESVEVIEHGIYTADEQSCHRDEQGILECARADVHHSVTTLTVPAQHGIHFGFRYRIVGTPDGASVKVTRITNFPPPGLSKPGAPELLRKYQYTDDEKVGQVGFVDYSFDDPWELVGGSWTIEIWIDNRRRASETFTVVQQ